jgi:hypothetical protein
VNDKESNSDDSEQDIEDENEPKKKRSQKSKDEVDMDIIGDLDDEDWESLICSEGKLDKFWRRITVGEQLFVHYGKVGSNGNLSAEDI